MAPSPSSSPAWLAPRHLTGPNPLDSLSTQFPVQLLLLRARPTEQHLLHRYLVLFPFSTSQVCSYLIGGGSSTIQLRCESEASSQEASEVSGHLAVAWGTQGHLQETVQLAVAAARASQTGEALPTLLAAAQDELKVVDAPKPLGVCTWNALSGGGSTPEDYTASSTLEWLENLLANKGGDDSLAAAAVKTVLLDDGWQDVSTYVDFDEPVGDTHANRKALKSFQCRREWYDLDEEQEDEPLVAEPPQRELEEARMAQAAQRSKKFSVDSGYEGSPDAVRHLRELDDEAREGTCYELRDVVRRIKATGIERVGVWMTLCGCARFVLSSRAGCELTESHYRYWDGLHPESALSDTYTLRRVTLRSPVDSSDQGHLYLPILIDLRAYYTDYFTSLRAAGVDFVKVDDQAKVDLFYEQEVGEDEEDGSRPDKVGELRQAMLHEMRTAADRIFGAEQNAVVHCMSGSPRIWGGDLAVRGAKCGRSLVRNSDDYFPDEDDSHRWHVALNSVMTILTRGLRLVPDFDMAQGAHPYAGMHLPLRAFSSAPVYATDAASLEGWNRLVAITREGPRVLQSRAPACSGTMLEGHLWDDVVGQDDGQDAPMALKVGLPVPSAHGAHLGIWNCSTAPTVSTVVDAKDARAALGAAFPSMPEGARAVLLYDTEATFAAEIMIAELEQSATQPESFARPLLAVSVGQKEAKVLSLVPLFPVAVGVSQTSEPTTAMGCLGLLGKVTGLAAVRSVRLDGGEFDASVTPDAAAVTDQQKASPPDTLAGTDSSSTAAAVAAAPNSTRPGANSSRTFPTPQGRLPFLFAYFAGFFRRSSGDGSAPRTPGTEVSAMAHEFLRAPIRTFFREIRALVTFGYAAIVWAAGGAGVDAASAPATASRTLAAPSGSGTPESSAGRRMLLSVDVDYVGSRLGFYFADAVKDNGRIRFFLDGEEIEAHLVRANEKVPNIVEVDIESAWRRSLAGRAAAGPGNLDTRESTEGSEKQTSWTVSVQLVQ